MVKPIHHNNAIYAVNPAIDVYAIGDDVLEFYFINNRRRVTLQVSPQVIALVANIDGKKGIDDICKILGIDEKDNVQDFVDYLVSQTILIIPAEQEKEKAMLAPKDIDRYDRQIAFFTSLYTQSGYLAQQSIQQQCVLIFGVGAIGSGIAMQLAMSGVRHFILVDKDIVTCDSLERHFYFRESDIGRDKCALRNWNPQYNTQAVSELHQANDQFEVGGLASMSLFSISYAVIIILSYMVTGDAHYSQGRGELLFDHLQIDYLNVPKNPHCHVCGNQ